MVTHTNINLHRINVAKKWKSSLSDTESLYFSFLSWNLENKKIWSDVFKIKCGKRTQNQIYLTNYSSRLKKKKSFIAFIWLLRVTFEWVKNNWDFDKFAEKPSVLGVDTDGTSYSLCKSYLHESAAWVLKIRVSLTPDSPVPHFRTWMVKANRHGLCKRIL